MHSNLSPSEVQGAGNKDFNECKKVNVLGMDSKLTSIGNGDYDY